MLNDLAWRKVPRSLIRDENLAYISDLLPENLRCAPLSFMMVAYLTATDEGTIDLEDGIIFSRLIRCGTAEDVFTIAELLSKRKLIMPVIPGGTVYMILDWDVPQRPGTRAPRTMDERRRSVAAKIEQEQRAARETAAIERNSPNLYVDFNQQRVFTAPKSAADNFFCPSVDKNANFVDTERVERDKTVEIEREIRQDTEQNRDIRERIDTHTEGYAGLIDDPATPEKKDQEKQEEDTPESLAAKALQETNINVVSNGNKLVNNNNESKAAHSDIDDVYVIFMDFFAKNCLGFNETANQEALLELSNCILMLEDERNNARMIAGVFCGQFKKLVEGEGYYHNYPLTPKELLRPKTYQTVLSLCSRILCSQNVKSKAWSQQEAALAKCQIDKEHVYDELKAEYLKCGIDPEDEHALQQFLLQKKESAIK